MYSFKIGELVVISIHADAKEQSCVSPEDNFVVPKLPLKDQDVATESDKESRRLPQQSSTDTFGPGEPLTGGPHLEGEPMRECKS